MKALHRMLSTLAPTTLSQTGTWYVCMNVLIIINAILYNEIFKQLLVKHLSRQM